MKKWYLSLPFLLLQLSMHAQLEKVLELTGLKPISAAEAEKRVCAATSWVGFEALDVQSSAPKQYYREWVDCKDTMTLIEKIPGDLGTYVGAGHITESAITIPGSKYYAMCNHYDPTIRFYTKKWNLVSTYENPAGWYGDYHVTEGSKPFIYFCSLDKGIFVFNGDGKLVDSLTNGYLSSILTFTENVPIPNGHLATVTGTRKHWTFFHYDENRLYCLDKDKKVKWHYQSKGAISDVRIMEDRNIAVLLFINIEDDGITHDFEIRVLDLNTGKELAKCPVQTSQYNQYFNRANTFIFTSNNQSFANE
jgi:hypothetical protein